MTPPLGTVAAWPTPADLKSAGKARTGARLKVRGCRRHATWAGQIVSALELQSVTVAGTNAAATVLPHLARQLIAPRAQRADVAAQAGGPGGWPTLMCQVLTTRARDQGSRPPPSLLAETLGKTFDTGAQLASYAGLAPVTRRSGSSIRGEHVSHGGNKRLKRAMFLSAFASLRSDPVSRAYYQRKRDQDKTPWARPSPPRPNTA